MSLLGGIIGGVGKLLGGSKVGGLVSGLLGGGKKGGILGSIGKFASNLVGKGLGKILNPIKDAIGGLLGKLPGHLGGVVQDFGNQFLSNALSLLNKNVLGGMASFLGMGNTTPSYVMTMLQQAMAIQGNTAAGMGNMQQMGAFYVGQNIQKFF